MKHDKFSKIIKVVIVPWFKGIIVLWLAISLIFYILSNNIAVFLGVGILVLASGLPYLFIDYNRKRTKLNEDEEGSVTNRGSGDSKGSGVSPP